MVFQLDRDDLPRQDKEQSLGALPRGTQPTRGVCWLDHRQGKQHFHRPEECGVQRCWEIHLPCQEPQGEERAAQRHHLPYGGPEDGGDRQHSDAHHRGRGGGAHRPPHPLHAHQEGCPVHHQEDPGWEEGVSGELVGERQHRERLGRLQGGTKSTTKGMKQRHLEPQPARQRGGWAGAQAFPFSFLSKLPTLETCFYYTRACNLRCFSEKTLTAVGTGSFLWTRTGTPLGQRELPAPFRAKARRCWAGKEGAGCWLYPALQPDGCCAACAALRGCRVLVCRGGVEAARSWGVLSDLVMRSWGGQEPPAARRFLEQSKDARNSL